MAGCDSNEITQGIGGGACKGGAGGVRVRVWRLLLKKRGGNWDGRFVRPRWITRHFRCV